MANVNNEKKLKIGVVGCGGRGTGAAIQAIASDRDVRLVAIADVFKDQAQSCLDSLIEKYGDDCEWSECNLK